MLRSDRFYPAPGPAKSESLLGIGVNTGWKGRQSDYAWSGRSGAAPEGRNARPQATVIINECDNLIGRSKEGFEFVIVVDAQDHAVRGQESASERHQSLAVGDRQVL